MDMYNSKKKIFLKKCMFLLRTFDKTQINFLKLIKLKKYF